MRRPTLGIAINCQNEAPHLPATIAQFYSIADEIVVIDGGSMDDSVTWAKKMGARVFYQPWLHNHAFQKNLGASKLSTDWIYIHDPDERLDLTLLEIFPLLLTDKGQRTLMDANVLCDSKEYFDCLGIPRKNYLDGVQTPIYPDYQYRLWRNHCRYNSDPKHKVHPEIAGFVKRTEVDFLRNSLNNPARFNILHFKTEDMQKTHDVIFDKIASGELGENYPEDVSQEV